MKVLALPRLPTYKPLWVTAKNWRLTRELPALEKGRLIKIGAADAADEDEEEGKEEMDAEEEHSSIGVPGSRGHKKRPSPFSVLFKVGELTKGRKRHEREGPEEEDDVGGPGSHADAKADPSTEAGGSPHASPSRRPLSCQKRRVEEPGRHDDDMSVHTLPHEHMPKVRVPPRLGVRILERQRVTLDKSGQVSIEKEEMLSLVEGEYARNNEMHKLQLRSIIRAQAFMRAPMMPCLILGHKNKGDFPAWPEPIRDRNKAWKDDPEVSFLYLKGLDDLVVGRRERKWFKHGELGLGKYAKETPLEAGRYEVSIHGDLMQRQRMCRYACMISHTYAILTIHGLGIHGRLAPPKLPSNAPLGYKRRPKARFLQLEVYTPHNSRVHHLRFHADELEAMFTSHGADPSLLAAGHKTALLRALATMVHFEYAFTETFRVTDEEAEEEDRLESVATRYRHTDKWPVDPYTWQPSDEVDPREVEAAEARRLARRAHRSVRQRRRIVAESQREERLAMGGPAEERDPLVGLPSNGGPSRCVSPLSLANSSSVVEVKGGGKGGAHASKLAAMIRKRTMMVTAKGGKHGPGGSVSSSGSSSGGGGKGALAMGKTAPVPVGLHKKPRGPLRLRVGVKVEEFLILDGTRQLPANMAEKRRHDLRLRRRLAEIEAERKRRAWLALPLWRRGLEVARPLVVNGMDCVGMVIRRPEAPTIVTLRMYDRRQCTTATIRLNLAHMCRAVHVHKRPEKWAPGEARRAFLAALRGLRYTRSTNDTAPRQGASMLVLDDRVSDDVALLKLRPMQLLPLGRWPFHPPPTVLACVPRVGVDERDKVVHQRLPCCLGSDGATTKGRWGFKLRCPYRRDLVLADAMPPHYRCMCSGVVRVRGVHCVFSVYWSGSFESLGDEVTVFVYHSCEVVTAGGRLPPFGNHSIAFSWEDVRCATMGQGLVEMALSVLDEQGSVSMAIVAEKASGVQACEAEYEELKERLANVQGRLARLTLAGTTRGKDEDGEESLREAEGRVAELQALCHANRATRREIDERFEATYVARAEQAWEDIGRCMLRRCDWVNTFDLLNECKVYEAIRSERREMPPPPSLTTDEEEGEEDEEEDGDEEGAAPQETELTVALADPINSPPNEGNKSAGATAGVAEEEPLALKEEVNQDGALCLRYPTRIYRHGHKVLNQSKHFLPDEPLVRVLVSVFQKRESLFFVAYEPQTCTRFRYMYEPELHKPMITGWHDLTDPTERTIQMALCVESLCFVDKPREDGSEEMETVLEAFTPQEEPPDLGDDIFGDLSELGDLLEAAAARPRSRASVTRSSRPSSAASNDPSVDLSDPSPRRLSSASPAASRGSKAEDDGHEGASGDGDRNEREKERGPELWKDQNLPDFGELEELPAITIQPSIALLGGPYSMSGAGGEGPVVPEEPGEQDKPVYAHPEGKPDGSGGGRSAFGGGRLALVRLRPAGEDDKSRPLVNAE